MTQERRSEGSRFLAFWSSLPGVLTGAAGVLAAVATLAALFVGGDDTAPSAPAGGTGTGPTPSSVPGAAGAECFSRYFQGIPAYRLGTVEAGAYIDVLSESEPKAGPIGITFTDFGRLIGGIRFAFFPANTFFKIESVVDERCSPVEEYESRIGGDKHNWRDASDVRIRLGDGFYDVTASGGGSIVRVSFVSVAP